MGQPAARCSTRADVGSMTRVAPTTARPWWRAVVLLVVVAMVSAGFAAAEPAGAAVEGPGGPILVVSSAVHPFSEYYVEILRNEGLNAFDAVDITSVTPATLAAHDVVVLGEIPIDASQAAMLAAWVADGGNLIAMRPDPDLASLVGVTDTGTDLSDEYLQIDTAAGTPGAGLVGQTIQFHGTADRYDLVAGTDALATLWSTASTATTNPAVTLRSVGSNGGQVAAFAYDLARSVVYTRQGNPAWAGQERDGELPPSAGPTTSSSRTGSTSTRCRSRRPTSSSGCWRTSSSTMNRDVMPLPRFWYFPRGERAVVVMTGDDHASSDGTAGQFDWAIGASPAGCDVDEWECVRGTSYVYPNTPLSDAAAAAYEAQGFEVAAHVTTGCADWTPEPALADFFDDQLSAFAAAFPERRPADDQPHPLHHLERLGDAPEARARRGHPPRHELLLLAGVVGEQPTRVLHGLRPADALRRPRRLPDRRLPGRDADDRRERHRLRAPHHHAARQRAGRARLLRRHHREHAHRQREPPGAADDRQRRAGARRAGGVGPPDADVARRPERLVVRGPGLERHRSHVLDRRRLPARTASRRCSRPPGPRARSRA